MRFARAVELDRVLAGFRQLAGIGRANRRIAEPVEHPRRGIAPDRQARVSCPPRAFRGTAPKPSGSAIRTALPRCTGSSGVQLAAIDEEIDRLVAMEHGKAQRQRRMRHVATANIEQPRDRIRRGQHHRIGALFLGEARGDARAFGRGALAGEAYSCGTTGAVGGGGRSVQTASIALPSSGYQACRRLFRRRAIARDLAERVQPRVVAERRRRVSG